MFKDARSVSCYPYNWSPILHKTLIMCYLSPHDFSHEAGLPGPSGAPCFWHAGSRPGGKAGTHK